MTCTTISFMNRKGGVGKSTCVRMFASVADERGMPVTLIDTDEFVAVAEWHTAGMENDRWSESVTSLKTMDQMELLGHVIALKEAPGEHICLIDTQGSSSEIMGMIFEVSDFIVVPTRLSRSDTSEVGKIMRYVDLYRAQSAKVASPRILINAPKSAGESHRAEMSALFDSYGEAILDEMLAERTALNEMDQRGLLNVMRDKGPAVKRKYYEDVMTLARAIFDEVTEGKFAKENA